MIQRHITAAVRAALRDSPVVLLHGARQTGKSTLVGAVAGGDHAARYLTLDDAGVLAAARHDPAGFLDGLQGRVALDEVQRAPDLFPALKAAVDRDRTPGRFLLTGSANVLLLPRLAESLVGRMEILPLWPFSQGEIEGVREGFVDALFRKRLPSLPRSGGDAAADLPRRMLLGGYPEVRSRAAPERRRAWFGSYLTTLLQRDVRDLARIEGLTEMPRLLALLATRVAGLFNASDISRGCGMPLSTLKRYLSLLETTFLVQFLPPWFTNSGQRLVKAPKLQLSDTGLAAHLLGIGDAQALASSSCFGALLENFVGTELRKQLGWARAEYRLYHFRSAVGREVDLVLEQEGGRLAGVEVKAAAQVGADDFKGLHALAELAGERFHRGIVLYRGAEAIPFGAKLHALPIDALWRMEAVGE
ncbi:MAG: ATP-binding protein [Planctomycetes bacterium]|nr:ATP-binding protein [Planctomycetota bacterium]